MRQSIDLSVLHVLRLGNENISYNILSLPNDKFLINTRNKDKKFFLINILNDEVEETISYNSNQKIQTTVLIGGKCLVVQTPNPGYDAELRFHDL